MLDLDVARYTKYGKQDKLSLHAWFSTLYKKGYLKDSELQEIECRLSSLSNSDSAYVRFIENITDYAENKASIILKLLDSDDIPNAKIKVKKIKDDLAQPRQQLSRELGDMTKKGYGVIKTKSTEIKPKVFHAAIWKRIRKTLFQIVSEKTHKLTFAYDKDICIFVFMLWFNNIIVCIKQLLMSNNVQWALDLQSIPQDTFAELVALCYRNRFMQQSKNVL